MCGGEAAAVTAVTTAVVSLAARNNSSLQITMVAKEIVGEA